MNYVELTQAIQDYVESTESLFVTNIPVFITQAELRIVQSVQNPILRKNVTGILTANNKYLSSPSDFLAPYSLAVISVDGTYNYLMTKDVSFMREAYPNPTTVGLPKFYSIFGPTLSAMQELSFILAPTPDLNYNVELHYFYYPESITTSATGTTWLGDNYSPVLLYGALREAVLFQKGEQDMVTYYEAKYQEALQQYRVLCEGFEESDSYRIGTRRAPIK
jgi:hypothetical protein